MSQKTSACSADVTPSVYKSSLQCTDSQLLTTLSIMSSVIPLAISIPTIRGALGILALSHNCLLYSVIVL